MVEEVPEVGGDGLPKVPIDELDFDFVEKCTDHKKLRDILAILESGKEGHYPELIQTTIDRLLATLPAKEKKLFISLRSKPSATEEDEAKSSLSDWIGEISKIDAAVSKKVRQPGAEAQDSKEIFADQDDNDNAFDSTIQLPHHPVMRRLFFADEPDEPYRHIQMQVGAAVKAKRYGVGVHLRQDRWRLAGPDRGTLRWSMPFGVSSGSVVGAVAPIMLVGQFDGAVTTGFLLYLARIIRFCRRAMLASMVSHCFHRWVWSRTSAPITSWKRFSGWRAASASRVSIV